MSMQPNPHPYAGQKVMVRVRHERAGVCTGAAIVRDWWTRAGGAGWCVSPDGQHLFTMPAVAVRIYVIRATADGVPLAEEPVYVYQQGYGALVHPSEIVGPLDEGIGLFTIDAATLGPAVPGG